MTGMAALTYKIEGEASRAALAADAERRFAKVERYLIAAYMDAVAHARSLVSEEKLAELIAIASGIGVLRKADDPKEIAWDESAVSRLAILGRPMELVYVEVAAFDEIWRDNKLQYVARAGEGLIQSVRENAARGAMLAPPIVADLGDHWAFLDGRNRYLYTREAGFKVLPLAVPADDAEELHGLAGDFPLPVMGERLSRSALARPHSDLFEAIEYVSLALANRFFSAVLAAALVSAENEGKRISEALSRRARAKKLDVAVDFSSPNTAAMAELQLAALNLIREFSADQRSAVLAALREGIERGANPREVARIFRGSIGLTSAQNVYVDNYRRALERAHADTLSRVNALDRALRDGRFDRTVASAARTGTPLEPAQIDKMVDRYRERFIAHRAEVIGRTQGLGAVHMGEAAVWQTAIDNGDVRAEEILQTWNTAHDERVRGTHRPMDRQVKPWGAPFLTGGFAFLRFPGDPMGPPREVINCRCVLTRNLTEQPIDQSEFANIEQAIQENNSVALITGDVVSIDLAPQSGA